MLLSTAAQKTVVQRSPTLFAMAHETFRTQADWIPSQNLSTLETQYRNNETLVEQVLVPAAAVEPNGPDDSIAQAILSILSIQLRQSGDPNFSNQAIPAPVVIADQNCRGRPILGVRRNRYSPDHGKASCEEAGANNHQTQANVKVDRKLLELNDQFNVKIKFVPDALKRREKILKHDRRMVALQTFPISKWVPNQAKHGLFAVGNQGTETASRLYSILDETLRYPVKAGAPWCQQSLLKKTDIGFGIWSCWFGTPMSAPDDTVEVQWPSSNSRTSGNSDCNCDMR